MLRKPIDEFRAGRFIAGTIDCGQLPSLILCTEVKLAVMPKLCLSRTAPANTLLHHKTRIPPEAPTDGIKSKQSKRLGANFLI
jgi:hypothetical protein